MSELKVYVKPIKTNMFGKMIVGQSYYLKSEADQVIAELKEKLKEQTSIAEEGWKEFRTYHTSYAEAVEELYEKNKEFRHQKYKRCLAMAEWCEATALWSYQAANTLPVGFHATLYGKPVMIEPGRLFKRYVLLTKWHKRWLELAEKFKEAK